ncbi:MAG: twin-arginine translocation signal domain-containing protein [Coriobacteriales bacterium]|nr:twin-arginine translocation signal domain-containing protein [Coriobacteriales bacterium]
MLRPKLRHEDNKHRFKLSRRGFLRGLGLATAAGAAAGTAVTILPGCSDTTQHVVPEPMNVETDKSLNILEEYEEADLELKERANWSLPLGSVLHESTGTWVAVTQAGSSAVPMVKGCAFSTETGDLVEVVSNVQGDSHTTVVYDVGCSDEVYAWVELNILTHEWTLFAAHFSDGKLSAGASTLWEADANYDPPSFVCVGNRVLWQITPALEGDKTAESSFCYLWHTGDSSAKAVVESHGRFPTAPSISGNLAILVPRVREDEGVYYGITAYSLDDDLTTIVDQMVLPHTIKPFYATRIGERFVVSIEANYSSGGMFGNMGTYIGPSSGPFVRLSREPSANVAGKDNTFIIKSRASYFVVNLKKATYSTLTAANRCVDYGEYPVRVGETDEFTTYATVKDEASGFPISVTVRSFKVQ